MTTKKTTKTKKEQKPVRQPDAEASLKKGLIKVSMTMTDGVLKMENTADQAVKSVEDVKDFINLLVEAVSIIDKIKTKDLCCIETKKVPDNQTYKNFWDYANEEACVGPCYWSQN